MDIDRLLAAEEEMVLAVDARRAGARLDAALAALMPWTSRRRVAAWIREGRAALDGRTATKPSRRLRLGERATVAVPKTPRDLGAPWGDLLAIPVIHRGPDWIAVAKPAGLACHPAGGVIKRTLIAAIAVAHAGTYASGGPWLPHRLDRDTSGLVVVALARAAQRRFARAFAAGRIRRLYRARVRGAVAGDRRELCWPLRVLATKPSRVVVAADGLPATTRMRVLTRGVDTTVLEVEPLTGRQHQIRVHLAHAGHPIVGDPLYDGAASGPPMLLHAHALEIPADVAGGEARAVRSLAPSWAT